MERPGRDRQPRGSRSRGAGRRRRRRTGPGVASSPSLTIAVDAPRFERLDDTRPARHQRPLPGLHQQRRGHRGADDVAGRVDADVGERPLLGGDRRRRVVRDEQDPAAARLQGGDRLDRTGDRVMRQPDDAVEVAQHGFDLVACALMRSRSLQLSGRGVASCGRAQVHPVRRAALQRRLHRRSHRPALRRAVRRATSTRSNARERAQHHPRRRSPRVRRARPLRRGRRHDAASGSTTACSSPIATPTFTIYRMRFTDATGADRDIVGVLGGLEVVDEGAGGVLPHERVTPKASTDRLDLTRSTRANLSPVWGLSLATGLTELLAAPAEPIASVTVDGVEHIVERVDRPGADRRHRRGHRIGRRADRRRPPPLRDQPHLPRRAARGDRRAMPGRPRTRSPSSANSSPTS